MQSTGGVYNFPEKNNAGDMQSHKMNRRDNGGCEIILPLLGFEKNPGKCNDILGLKNTNFYLYVIPFLDIYDNTEKAVARSTSYFLKLCKKLY